MSRVVVLDVFEAMMVGGTGRTLRIGAVLPLSGVLGITGPTVVDAATLAAHEINGRSDDARQVELVLLDSGAAPARVAEQVALLTDAGVVTSFVGLHTSETLQHVERGLGSRLPYIFAPGHEGTDRTRGVYCVGETPAQAEQGIRWIQTHHKVERWAILGTDYVWPRTARVQERADIQAAGGQVVYDLIVPTAEVTTRIVSILNEVQYSGAQAVIINMPGRDLLAVLRAMQQTGLDQRLVRYSPGSLEENILYALGGDTTGSLYASMHAFDSLQTDEHQELNKRYHQFQGGGGPVLTSWGTHTYDALHLLAALDRSQQLTSAALGTVDGGPRMAAMTGGPRPKQYVSYLAVSRGLAFEIVARTPSI